jgi:hypothetical protein
MKITKYLILLLIVVLCSAPLFAQTIDENSDIVGWSDVTFIIPLKKKEENGKKVDQWILNLGGIFRYGRNLKRPIDERASVSLNYRFNQYFTSGSTYLYRRYRLTEAHRLYEHRVMFYLLAEKKWTNFTLRNRAMITYFIKNSRPDTVVYRNRIQANFPLKKDGKEIVTPFIADEPFYDFREKRWFRNDIFLGVSKQFTPKFGADFFYLHQGINTGALRQVNGFGMSFRYRLDFIK